jgi:hypothetical protein
LKQATAAAGDNRGHRIEIARITTRSIDLPKHPDAEANYFAT